MTTSKIVLRAALPASAALLVGTALAGWGGTGQESMVVTIAGAAAAGILGNMADRSLLNGSDVAGDLMARLQPDGRLPPNHDLARAIRRSQLRALVAVAGLAIANELQAWNNGDISYWTMKCRLDLFAKKVRKWSKAQARLSKQPGFVMTTGVTVLAERIDLLCDEAGVLQAPEWQRAGDAVLQELTAAGVGDRPVSFDQAVSVGAGSLAWSTAVHAFLWEEIKRETSVYRVLSLRMLNRIDHRPLVA